MERFFASCPKGLEALVSEELVALGARECKSTLAGVAFAATWPVVYKILIWSRLISRVRYPLSRFSVSSPDSLYEHAAAIPWSEHFSAKQTFMVEAAVSGSLITHGHYAALRVKDAVVDQFRDKGRSRPSVDRLNPDLRLHLVVKGREAILSLDLGGGSLHQRGYRAEGGVAPLKENLAAALLIRAGWPEIAAAGGPLLDPLCGSGTLLIEGALMAGSMPPSIKRGFPGLASWKGFDRGLWREVQREAETAWEEGRAGLHAPILGFDNNREILKVALHNAEKAGLRDRIRFEYRPLQAWHPDPSTAAPGLLITNPPYGERLGEEAEITALYTGLGALLRNHFPHWRAAVFTSRPELGQCLGIRAEKRYKLYNGALSCQLLNFHITPAFIFREHLSTEAATVEGRATVHESGTEMFRNRLLKNLKELSGWAEREKVSCYRLYDADMPEYNVAVDLYGGHAVIQEYQAPGSVDPHKAALRLRKVLQVVPQVLAIHPKQVILKVRKRQKSSGQYERLERSGQFLEVTEGGYGFRVNLKDYLDTGLFLDHRLTRGLIESLAAGQDFLNLFAYTGSATVYAAGGGARSTLTVDLSETYLDWARENMALNGFTQNKHSYLQADCRTWLKAEGGRRFGLIFLDPPTFSNSKRMEGHFDLQRDHVDLIRSAAGLLNTGGILIFSTNFRKFKLDEPALKNAGLDLRNLSRRTLPRDFARNPKIHQCWQIREKKSEDG